MNVTCETGYKLDGNAVLVCSSSGQWSPAVPSCSANCPAITSQHMYINSTETSYGSIVKVACDNGYKVEGEAILTCLSSGQWSAPIPSCIIDNEKCPTITSNHTYVNSTETSYGSVVKVACDTGYKVEGEAILTCLSSGQWSAPIPTCVVDNSAKNSPSGSG